MKRILVAEDNDSNYLLMTFILKGHYEYFRACNGQEAVDKASTEHPDLILMDLKMPKMDGLTATKQIKGMLPNLPIVALCRTYRQCFRHRPSAGYGGRLQCFPCQAR